MNSKEIGLYRQAGLATDITGNEPLVFNRSWGFCQMNAFFCSKLPKLFTYLAETYPQILETTAESVDDKASLSKTLWPYILLVKDRRVYSASEIDYPTAAEYFDGTSRPSGGGSWGERTIHLCAQNFIVYFN
jgi:hypothetical protein